MPTIDIRGTLIKADEEGAMLIRGYTDYTVTEQVVQAIKEAQEPITLLVNSGGGNYFGGAEIYSALRASEQKSTAYVQSLAGSASAIATFGAGQVVISPSAQLMVHQSAVGAFGKSQDLQEASKMLDSIDDSIALVISKRSGMTAEDAKTLIATDRFISPSEAIELKLADSIGEVKNDDGGQAVSSESDRKVPSTSQTENQVKTSKILNLFGGVKVDEKITELLERIAEALEGLAPEKEPEKEPEKLESDDDPENDDDVIDSFLKALKIQNQLKSKVD